jgi:hypothetical protein
VEGIIIIVNVLGHPKGEGGLTFYFLCGRGMDVFWNDPFSLLCEEFIFIDLYIHFLDLICLHVIK